MTKDTLHKTCTIYSVWGFDTTVKRLGRVKTVIGRIEITHFSEAIGGDFIFAWFNGKRKQRLGNFPSIQAAYEAINKANEAYNPKVISKP